MASSRNIETEDYLWKTDPYKHQRKVFLRSRDEEAFAYLMGMGTGKTKVTIDVAAWNYKIGTINCLLVIAPNGVHRNWTRYDDFNPGECQVHMPDWTDYKAIHWVSPNDIRAQHKKDLEAFFDPEWKGLRVISMNVEAFRDSTKCPAAKFVRLLINSFNILVAVDESSKIKTPGAKRTRALTVLARHCTMRRILTGTPVTNGPLDIYSQFQFLGGNLLGFDNFFSFKHYFAAWVKQTFEDKAGRKREFEELVGYRNIDELNALIDAHSFRITKEECLDLPPKIFQTRYVELSPKQRKHYNTIAERSLIELDNGEEMSIQNVLTKALRLQQVVGGFLPTEELGETTPIEDSNARILVMKDIIEETEGKVIIWARFRPELALIEQTLRKEFGADAVVSYHGGVDKETREKNVNAFQKGVARFFVGQQHSGGYGLTLHAASDVIYFSNDFSLEARLQSEDRAHRIGQTKAVNYTDIECLGTIDSKIIAALRAKLNLADMVTRDSVRQLLAQAAKAA